MMLVQDLVTQAISCLNIWRTTAINQNEAPRVMCTGLKVDFRKEMCLLLVIL
jgi:thymidine kinase